MNQSATKAAEMSSRYGASRDTSDNVAGLTRTKSESVQTSDSAAITQSSLKMLHVQSLSVPGRTSKGVNHSMRAHEDDLSTTVTLPRSQTLPEVSTKSTNIASRRGFDFNLSSRFDDFTRATSHAECEQADPFFQHNFVSMVVKRAMKHPFMRSTSLGPLTPPHEAESFSWLPFTSAGHIRASNEVTTNGVAPAPANALHSGGVPLTAAGENVLSAVEPFASQNVSGDPWLLRAFRVASMHSFLRLSYIH